MCQSGPSLPCISFRKLVLGLLHSFGPGQLLETFIPCEIAAPNTVLAVSIDKKAAHL